MTTAAATGPARLFADARAILGESLVWDASTALLWWTDIPRGTLNAADASGRVVRTSRLTPPLACFQPRAEVGFVAATGDGVLLTDADGEPVRRIASVHDDGPHVRSNEGKCDPYGRFLVGGMKIASDTPDVEVVAVTADGATSTVHGGFVVANGMEWSEDGDVMYVTDTAVSTIYRGSYDPDGRLGELEPFVKGGSFDGLTKDDEGCLWTAVNGEGRVERYSASGELLEAVAVPTPNVTSVAFGGADMATLFVATAREQMTEEQLAATPGAGGVFAVPTRVRGFLPNRFGA